MQAGPVIEGRSRTDVPYRWPTSLTYRLSDRRPVYLDLNHWIGLAKAAKGHPDGARYVDLLQVCRAALRRGDAVFPLSGQHYAEMAGIRDPRHRRDIATVMLELSEFRTLICRSLVMRLEVEAVLDARIGPRKERYAPLEVIGVGIGHAFGMSGQVRIGDAQGHSPEEIREQWPGGVERHDRLLAEFQYMAEWAMLRGPHDEELDDLRAHGFDADTARRGQERRAQQEREQARRLDEDPRWRRGRLRDVISARYVLIELYEMLQEGVSARGSDIDDVFDEQRESFRAFVDGMPSGDVHVSLQVAAHSNPQTPWKPNDYFDIDALSLAVPYCTVVATDRQRAHELATSEAPARLNTVVVASPEELMSAFLDQM